MKYNFLLRNGLFCVLIYTDLLDKINLKQDIEINLPYWNETIDNFIFSLQFKTKLVYY